MKPYTTALERAFELARSGRFFTVSELRSKLAQEGYHTDVMEGPVLIGQLKNAMEQSKARRLDWLDTKDARRAHV